MFRAVQRALVAVTTMGLIAFAVGAAPTAAAAECALPGVPVIQQFAMDRSSIQAPSGDATADTTLRTQVDHCGAEQVTLTAAMTGPDDHVVAVPGFPLEGTGALVESTLSWSASQVGPWQFSLTVASADAQGIMQQASASFGFTVQAPVAPGLPTSVSITDTALTSGMVTWQAPNGDVPVTGYRVTGAGVTADLPVLARSHILRGLQPGQTYRISVRAMNAHVLGPAAWVDLKTLDRAPGAVRGLKTSQRTPTSGRVTWQIPSPNGGSAITGFRIVKPGADVTVAASTRSFTVKGLKPGRSYALAVKARNAEGYGPVARVTLRTPATKPGKARSLKISKRTTKSAKLSWRTPATNGGARITGFRIVKPGRDVTVKATARSYTIKGLKPGRTYTVAVKARNAKGYGASTRITFTTKRAAVSKNCTPGYSPCLPPASDYDCFGGSGDGPKYVDGPVFVNGSDPYDLDRDGNGIGCES